jgi:hypothetical protein
MRRIIVGIHNPNRTPTPPISGLISPSRAHCGDSFGVLAAEITTIMIDKATQVIGRIRTTECFRSVRGSHDLRYSNSMT